MKRGLSWFLVLVGLIVWSLPVFATQSNAVSTQTKGTAVKDAWILDEDFILVLRESGDLFSGVAIDEQNPQLITTEVVNLYFGRNLYDPSLVEGKIQFSNGDIADFEYGGYNYEGVKIKNRVKANAYIIYDEGLYIDKNNTLKKDNKIIYEGAKKFCGTSFSRKYYIINTANELYSYCEEEGNQFIMGNVNDVILDGDCLAVLRNNNDLYYYEEGYAPIRIGTNVVNIKNVFIKDEYVDYLDAEGVLYRCQASSKDEDATIKKARTNVKEIMRASNGNLLVIDNNSYMNIFSDRSLSNVSITQKSDWTGFIDDKYHTDAYGRVCTGDLVYNITDVKKVISHYSGSELLLKNNGELWGVFKVIGQKRIEPFITSFCQKKMKVIINGRETELKAKIQIVNDRSMYPFRECLEAMGATVLWDSINKIAIGEYNGTTIEFPLGKKAYYVNGEKHNMDISTYADESIGRTYIPIRYAAEGLGFTVDWIPGSTEDVISIHR